MSRIVLRSLVTAMVLCALPAAAQETEDDVTMVTATASGAVYEDRMGIDGALASESYMLTRLTCHRGSKTVQLLMPIERVNAEGQDGNTLVQKNGAWQITLKVGKQRIVKPVKFVKITDPISGLEEGTEIEIDYGDVVWKAMTNPKGNGFMALTSSAGDYVAVFDDANLHKFEKLCGFKR